MFNEEGLRNELSYKASRSSGSGGQHVNKVSTKIELIFNVVESSAFDEDQRQQILNNLKSRITKEGVLKLQCGESRSQLRNKELVTERFFELIKKALVVPKKRKPTKVSKAAINKRLKQKNIHAEKKANRRKPDLE